MSFLHNEIEYPLHIKTASPMTDAEFARFCAANEPARFERAANGEIIVMSPSFSEGGGIELDVAGEFRNWALVDGRGRAFGPSARFTLPDGSIRAADVSWIRWERWNAFSEDKRHNSFTPICPEFVIEVRSASDGLSTVREKMAMWIANGAEVAWLMNPERKVVEIYRPGESPKVRYDLSSVLGSGSVAGFELVMARVWG